ncbi:hypothetical protein G8B32_10745 [Enterococcus faecalis]|uniref:hypothetical protein n=1 Tax=Enterococcus faecalis TaxID=1351 RepID=UPI0018836ABF|nr:hypothetical protein [Enterococcus faecalis]MBE9855096.1 hypothetical protein [Enterococcus faecalis]
MYFHFVSSEMEEVPNEQIPLSKVNDYLKDLNDYLQGEEQKGYPFQLKTEEEEVFYSGYLYLPTEKEGFSLYDEINKQLEEIHSEEAKQLADFLKAYFVSMSSNKDEKKEKEEKEEKELFEEEKESETKELSNQKMKRRINRKFSIVVVVVLFFSCMASISYVHFMKKTSFKTLIQTEEYIKAGENYPDKVNEIEQMLYMSILEKQTAQKIKTLKQFTKKFSTTFGSFDVSIFEKDYSSAIQSYEAKKGSFINDTERLTLVGYAYLKEEAINEAQTIQKQISSIELEEKIFRYEQLTQAIEEKEAELEKLSKEGSKKREQAEKVANEKFKLKEELQNL